MTEQQTDGLGRTHGEQLVDQATGDVEAERLREFAALCRTFAEDPRGVWSPWGRLIARWTFRIAADTADNIAGELDGSGLSLGTIRRYIERNPQ